MVEELFRGLEGVRIVKEVSDSWRWAQDVFGCIWCNRPT